MEKIIQNEGFQPSSQMKWDTPSKLHLMLKYIVICASLWYGLYACSGAYSKDHCIDWGEIGNSQKDEVIHYYTRNCNGLGRVYLLFDGIRGYGSYDKKTAYKDYLDKCNDRIFTGVSLFIILLAISTFLPLKKFPPKTKLSEYCDYIQPFKRSDKYVIYIWKNKWGVMDVENYKPAIDPIYDHLEWLVKNEKLICTINGQESYITVKNRRVYYEELSDKTKNNKPLYLFLSICVVSGTVFALYNLFDGEPYNSNIETIELNQNGSNVSFTGSSNFRKTTYRCGICGCEGYWGYEHGNGAYEGSCSNTRPGGHSCGHSPQQHNLKQW